jgi:4-amino-4-deoxy-L-arabinose transferase-like glycosyltransferase
MQSADARNPQPLAQRVRESIPLQCLGVFVVVAIYHKLLSQWMRITELDLGALRFHHAVPLYAKWDVSLTLWVLPALTVLVLFVALSRRWLLQRNASTRQLLLIASCCFVVIGVSVSMVDGILDARGQQLPAFLEPYSRAGLEYYGDVPKVDQLGLATFLRQYSDPKFFSSLSVHAKTHPPGGILFLWMTSKLFGHNLVSACLVSIWCASMMAVVGYLIAARFFGDRAARYAVVLLLLMPNVVMFSATSMDGPFAVLPLLSIWLFYEADADETGIGRYSVLAGVAIALSAFMTYATVLVGLVLGVVLVANSVVSRRAFRKQMRIVLTASCVFAVFYLALFLATGFSLIEAALASVAYDSALDGTGHETVPNYLHRSVANLVAFLIGIGVPVAVLWLRQVRNTVGRLGDGTADAVFVASCFVSVLIMSFSTLFTLEVERVWLFMSPLVVIPAAKYLYDRCEETQCLGPFRWTVVLLALQLLVSEICLDTYW